MEILLQNYNACRDELNNIRSFLRETISPYLCELSETVLGKSKPTEKVKSRTAYQGLKDILQAHAKINSNISQSIVSSHTLTLFFLYSAEYTTEDDRLYWNILEVLKSQTIVCLANHIIQAN